MNESPQNNSFWAFLNKNTHLYWKGYCNKDRNTAIFEIENIVNNHGYIIDFRMFSDMEICLKIEIEERKIQDLYDELNNYIALNEVKNERTDSERERTVLINITFTQSMGNLRIEVPAVPG